MQPEEPPVPEATLIQVTVELHLANGRATSLQEPVGALRDSIFAHYGIDEEQYFEAVEYYSARPEEYGQFYDSVLDSLNTHRP